MNTDDPDHKNEKTPPANPEKSLIRFPQSRVRMGRSDPPRQLGYGKLSSEVRVSNRSAMGHWCSHCRGIWYSHFLETECPKCGNRHG